MSESERKPKAETPMSQSRGGLARPRNWLEPTVLLMLRDSSLYGYKLMERLTAFGYEAVNPGTMYRTLRHMEENGVLKSKWETTGDGPARRMYSVTQAGEAYLDLWVNSLKQYQQMMDTFFRLYTGEPSRRPRADEKDR